MFRTIYTWLVLRVYRFGLKVDLPVIQLCYLPFDWPMPLDTFYYGAE